MKSKEELIGDYREMVEITPYIKMQCFWKCWIDIRDVLAAIEKRMHPMHDPSKESQSSPEPANPKWHTRHKNQPVKEKKLSEGMMGKVAARKETRLH